MTNHPEHEPFVQPAPPRHDGWWDKMIAAILEELDGAREETRERGPGR